GVDQDDVGFGLVLGQHEAVRRAEHVGHLGRVVLVHLAPVRLDVELAGHRRKILGGPIVYVVRPGIARGRARGPAGRACLQRDAAYGNSRAGKGSMTSMLRRFAMPAATVLLGIAGALAAFPARAGVLYKCEGPNGSIAYT